MFCVVWNCLVNGLVVSTSWIFLDLSLCFNVSLSFLGLICRELHLGLTGKISNGCDRQGGCGKAVWRKISVWSLRFYDPCIHHFSSMESLCFVSRFCLNLIMGAYGLSCYLFFPGVVFWMVLRLQPHAWFGGLYSLDSDLSDSAFRFYFWYELF